ncbi:VOC family protein [candidate division WOR-3 bacterium]|nr:VOC family protein [candidate division WOR-3 bacterium]
MKIGHIELFVADPLKLKDFYVDVLGFEEVAVQGETFVWVKSGDVEILLRPGRNPSPAKSYQQAAAAITLYCDDLEKVMEKLKSHGIEFKGYDGSEKCSTFTDPDGNWFQLVNPEEV